jgi:hypothetical protein
MKIYRDFSLERISKKNCAEFLQNLAKCNGHITSSMTLNNGFPDDSVQYMSMFFRIYFLNLSDFEKFHRLGMNTTEVEQVGA